MHCTPSPPLMFSSTRWLFVSGSCCSSVLLCDLCSWDQMLLRGNMRYRYTYHSAVLRLHQRPVGAVHLVVESTRVAEVVPWPVPPPEGGGGCTAVDTLPPSLATVQQGGGGTRWWIFGWQVGDGAGQVLGQGGGQGDGEGGVFSCVMELWRGGEVDHCWVFCQFHLRRRKKWHEVCLLVVEVWKKEGRWWQECGQGLGWLGLTLRCYQPFQGGKGWGCQEWGICGIQSVRVIFRLSLKLYSLSNFLNNSILRRSVWIFSNKFPVNILEIYETTFLSMLDKHWISSVPPACLILSLSLFLSPFCSVNDRVNSCFLLIHTSLFLPWALLALCEWWAPHPPALCPLQCPCCCVAVLVIM